MEAERQVDMASKFGELNQDLVTPTAVFKTSGYHSVVATGQDKVDFYLVKPCFQFGMNFKLLEGRERTGKVKLTLSKPAMKSTIRVMGPAGDLLTELKKTHRCHIRRTFTWEGREYVWQRSSGIWTDNLRFALLEVGTNVMLAEHSFSVWSLKHPGTLTVLEAGSHLPVPLVLATALSVEHLCLQGVV